MSAAARNAIRGHEAFPNMGRSGDADSSGPERIETGTLLSEKTQSVVACMKNISPRTSTRFRQGIGQ